MSNVTVAMTEAAYRTLTVDLNLSLETGYTAALGIARGEGGDLLFCIRELQPIPEAAYIERSAYRLVIASRGFMPFFGHAAEMQATASFVHTHPGGQAEQSDLDKAVDEALAPVAILRTQQDYYVSLIVGGTAEQPQFTGCVVSASGEVIKVDRVRVVGERLQLLPAMVVPHADQVNRESFDRQIRAFGEAGQEVLSRLTIGIAGVGGTGSAVAEQLARLGVGELIVVDDDVITASNVSRVYGSTVEDVGAPKVEVIARHLSRIRPGTRVRPISGRVTNAEAARQLRFCDAIFGCTDDQWGRSVLARMAYWYLTPLIDVAVMITATGSAVNEVIGRVTFVGPGSPCLLCRGRLHPDAIRAETLGPDERQRLAAEGYVQGLGEPDPSVVTYTSFVASLATSELLNRLFGLGHPPYPQELLWRADAMELRRNRVSPQTGHYCESPEGWGLADSEPFLGQLWT
ncbi:MAG: HesA/MoeB/ThiF family protein [Candidatus Acidiferrales bacterium]